ncbi:MAG: YHS domain-containing protein [Gammaproteobacteria bacterium]|nr:YHS domain-containing protein [Gammaproteobacteria bacterium]
MEGLLSFLLFAGVFYLMMRFGCGSHMKHGSNGDINHDVNQKKHTDPVCGMEVDIDKGYGKMHEGNLYRFCSRNCLDKFENEPDKYLMKNLSHDEQSNEGGAL